MDFCAPYNAMANITRTEFTESASFSQIAAQATNNEEEKNNLSPTPQSSTTHLISKQQLRDYEASFSKHQVNCTDANISLNSKNTSDACTPIDSHRNASEQTPDNHFDFKMVATVNSSAFSMSHSKTGVSLIFPEGAIDVGKTQRIEVQVSRKYAPFNLRFDDEDSDFPLTLVVNCLSPGLKRFSKPVMVKIPHRGILSRDSECKVLYSQSPVGSKMSWQCLEKPKEKEYNNIVSDCYFTVDETYFYIVAQHFTTYTCTCKATVPLNLQVIVYGRYELRAGNKQEVYFNMYLCDTIKDNQKAIENYEGQNANHTQFYSLTAKSPKNHGSLVFLRMKIGNGKLIRNILTNRKSLWRQFTVTVRTTHIPHH
ncbi:netrin receptor UNC5C-like [Ptychodera flava]|uniref:netrin receptor UNC5C-like n=1 Tax=Ptychodera flava TaxID=63121 RepID=UPI00396A89A5